MTVNNSILIHKPDEIQCQCRITLQQLSVVILPSDSDAHDYILVLKEKGS